MNTVPARPALRLSAVIVAVSITISGPIAANTENKRFVVANNIAPTNKGLIMPYRATNKPPKNAPVIVATVPYILIINPISVSEKPISM
ncbi:uncharacterized protein METZ01_LOCUS204353 [marine metagenome]|uniref:Uncharacterized protein n=1 Tax=marine metagenome TaxID=408172 RepID=A0A382EM69_9ZZZZ